jgi:hypothetical protein
MVEICALLGSVILFLFASCFCYKVSVMGRGSALNDSSMHIA